MQALQKSNEQFERRARIIIECTPIYLRPLADLIVEYCVSRYQLFQEALLYLFSHDGNHRAFDRMEKLMKELTELAPSHRTVAEFVQELQLVGSLRNQQLYSAMGLTTIPASCNRLTCYYSDHSLLHGISCTCTRPLFTNRIQTQTDLNYF